MRRASIALSHKGVETHLLTVSFSLTFRYVHPYFLLSLWIIPLLSNPALHLLFEKQSFPLDTAVVARISSPHCAHRVLAGSWGEEPNTSYPFRPASPPIRAIGVWRASGVGGVWVVSAAIFNGAPPTLAEPDSPTPAAVILLVLVCYIYALLRDTFSHRAPCVIGGRPRSADASLPEWGSRPRCPPPTRRSRRLSPQTLHPTTAQRSPLRGRYFYLFPTGDLLCVLSVHTDAIVASRHAALSQP